MNENFPKLEDLNVWKMCRKLRKDFINLTKKLSKEEKYRLSDQIIRASRSITNNIAEGYGRFNYQENIQFLRISRGSIYECVDHLYCCLDENIIGSNEFDKLYDQCHNCLRILNGYIRYLFSRKKKI